VNFQGQCLIVAIGCIRFVGKDLNGYLRASEKLVCTNLSFVHGLGVSSIQWVVVSVDILVLGLLVLLKLLFSLLADILFHMLPFERY